MTAELEGDIRAGKFAEVEPRLAAYVKERPSSSWGWYALGYSQFAQQKIGESIQALAKSLQLDIRNAEAHKILGRNLMIIGRFDAAQVEFEQALRYKPDSARAALQPRQAVLHPGQLGARAQGSSTPRFADRPRRTSKRSTRSASRWKRSATTRAPSSATRKRPRSTSKGRARSRRPT